MANQRKPVCQTACPGSDRVERGYQPRLIALSIVPNYLELSIVKVRARRRLEAKAGQLNTLQTVVLVRNHAHACQKENMVKPHG